MFGEALNLLDQAIRHEENSNIIKAIEQSNSNILQAIEEINDGIRISNDELRRIRKDISWTAYNTSTLRSRSYVGKMVDDWARFKIQGNGIFNVCRCLLKLEFIHYKF